MSNGGNTTRRERPTYEFVNAKWLQTHTFSEAGNALLRDLRKSVEGYHWVKTEEERRRIVLQAMVELGSVLLVTASREMREDAGLRERPKGKSTTEIKVVSPPSARLGQMDEVPA